jgi:hypothetical protein
MARSPAEAVSPPILSGHALEAADQVVIGAATLAVLHKHVGDTVYLRLRVPLGRSPLRATDSSGHRGYGHFSGRRL